MKGLRKLAGLSVVAGMLLSGCVIGGGGSNTFSATFSRAVQLFPASAVRVLGVNVGTVTNIQNVGQGVKVTFTVNSDTKLPADVQAAIVPASLLGERYVQLLPAYSGGPTLQPGSDIPESRTAVPAEPDELLRSLQNYLGALDPKTVTKFVEHAADVLEGNGLALNSLIHHGAGVISELNQKRADLAQIITEFNKVSTALATRQKAIGSLIHNYNVVAGTLVNNREALSGTITGLRDASAQLAALLIAHLDPLHGDVANLTGTAQTLSKNVERLADTGHWATRLFHAAQRAIDYRHRWLRLNNQGQPLFGMIVQRLEQRLVEFCTQLNVVPCSTPSFWSQHVPSLFCFKAAAACGAGVHGNPVTQLTNVIDQVPALLNALLTKAEHIVCTAAKYPDRCLQRKALLIKCAKAKDPKACLEKHAILLKCLKKAPAQLQACIAANKDADVKKLVTDLLKNTLGNPDLTSGLSGATGGLP
jgi:phospholipid/cholesterol/gamma-HCH transport system substrate-binding protein